MPTTITRGRVTAIRRIARRHGCCSARHAQIDREVRRTTKQKVKKSPGIEVDSGGDTEIKWREVVGVK